MSSKQILYIVGSLILTAGLAWGAYELDVPTLWIVIGSVVALGAGTMSAASIKQVKHTTHVSSAN